MATTPFGGGRFSASILQAHQRLDEQRRAFEKHANQTGRADKWQLLRALTEARAAFGLSDRTIAVLEALLSFHPEKELDGMEDIIVFPSNAELSLRTRGMAPATLRRHLAALVAANLVMRRDSPNGKRYARRDGSGQVDEAFGFNLAPFALMAADVFETAERANAHARAVKKVRAEITLHLRDISKMIDAAYEEGRVGHDRDLWMALQERLRSLSGRVSRTAPLPELEARASGLLRLRAETEKAWLDSLSDDELDAQDISHDGDDNQNMSANAPFSERHIQNSKTESHFEKSINKKEKPDLDASLTLAPEGDAVNGEQEEELGQKNETVSLTRVRLACPDFADYARDGLKDWPDALAAAAIVRPMLGISADAWQRAVDAMGQGAAITTLAYMVQRAGEIKSAGGYLRALTDTAETGGFSVKPMLDSLVGRG